MDFRRLMQEERRRAAQAKAADREAANAAPGNAQLPTRAAVTAPADTLPLATWARRSPIDLSPFRIEGIETVHYIPDWITEAEERAILDRVTQAPATAWVALRHRRLQMYGGEVTAAFTPEPLPTWVVQLTSSLVDAGVFPAPLEPNHALINEYGVGDKILPHEDGPSYHPLVAILSTGADATVTFAPHRRWATSDNDEVAQSEAAKTVAFRVRRRSLLLFTGDAYTQYLHGIDGVIDGTRISLTLRHVPIGP